ncbi:MAG: transporter substrate-binding domain-containing protein [Desulfovibrionaceae bacterium]|nr:transporter substrate-binding domain-containing protein [Desulfovibrionaceae bacterium]
MVILVVLLAVPCVPVSAEEYRPEVRFAVARGYPPYQFRTEDGQPTGLDVEVIHLIGERLNIRVKIIQGPWDEMVTALRVGKVDCLGGMEINAKRLQVLDFTDPYYSRKGAVFTLMDNSEIQTLEDLRGRIITGDRHSYMEGLFARLGIKQGIRIRQTESKDMSFRLLKQGKVVAVVAPKAVGYYLASRHNIAVRIIDDSDPGSPVGMAVIKGNTRLRDLLDQALDELRNNGKLNGVLRTWRIE